MDDQTAQKKIAALRVRIDAIDARLVKDLNRRSKVSKEIGKLKSATDSPILCPSREAALLDKVCGLSDGDLPPEHLIAIYREILNSSRALQDKARLFSEFGNGDGSCV